MIKNLITGVLEREGGYVDHPLDKGGPTNRGITIGTLSSWRNEKATPEDIKELSEEEAREIYTNKYWAGPGIDRLGLPEWAVEAVFDSAVLHGPYGTVRMLQRAAGVKADGVIGPKTIWAVQSLTPKVLTLRFIKERIVYLGAIVERSPGQAVFLKGWLNRATDLMLDVALRD